MTILTQNGLGEMTRFIWQLERVHYGVIMMK